MDSEFAVRDQLVLIDGKSADYTGAPGLETRITIMYSVDYSDNAMRFTGRRRAYENRVLLHSSVPHRPSGIIVPTISTIIHGRFT